MRIGDPFPVTTYAGGTATQPLDWAAMDLRQRRGNILCDKAPSLAGAGRCCRERHTRLQGLVAFRPNT